MSRSEKVVSTGEALDRATLKRILGRFLERLQSSEAVEAEVRVLLDELKAKKK